MDLGSGSTKGGTTTTKSPLPANIIDANASATSLSANTTTQYNENFESIVKDDA